MIVTRFPPSPTGFLHIGGARTALYSWLHARQNQGRFVLRIEDTDLERSTPESVQAILDGMQWLQLEYDEGPYYQTQRYQRYREVVDELLEQGSAYHCECSKERLQAMREEQQAAGVKPRYDGRCRELGLQESEHTVVRFSNPLNGDVVIDDLVKGRIVIANAELDDLVIARANGVPTYNLTVVVDDMDMGITHVIRGDDHVNNTPRQINILQALDAKLPQYAHVPMILGADGARLSKRHGAVSVMQYEQEGYLPEALLSYLARLGWSHGDQELFSMQELLQLFKIENVSRSAASYDPEKLLWVNQEFLRALSADELLRRSLPMFERAGIVVDADQNAQAVVALVQDRCKTLLDVVSQSRFFFEPVDEYDDKAVRKHIRPQSLLLMQDLVTQLEMIESWTSEHLHAALQSLVEQHETGFGKLAQPVRIAVTGGTSSPSIDQTLALLGKQTTLARLRAALQYFSDNAGSTGD